MLLFVNLRGGHENFYPQLTKTFKTKMQKI